MTRLLDLAALAVVWVFYAIIGASVTDAAIRHTGPFILVSMTYVIVLILMGYIKKRNLLND